MNSVILIGRLTRDPELRFTGSGKAVATFSIAVNRPFAKNNEADFFRIVVWGKTGENCANYLAKGRLVGIQGRIQNNNYETNSGEKRTSTEIVADRVEFLEWGNNSGGGNTNKGSQNSGGYNNAPANNNFQADDFSNFNDGSDGFQAIEDDDDVPF